MSFIFGGAKHVVKKNPFKEYQRDITRSVRSMDREDLKHAVQEKELISNIKTLAKEQKFDLCNARAKDLVTLRAHRHRLATMKRHMSVLQYHLSTVQSAQVIQDIVSKTALLLNNLNAHTDAKGNNSILFEFEKQTATFNDRQEIFEETLDSIFDADNENTITDQTVANVFSELGLEIQMELAIPDSDHQPNSDNLEYRLNMLKKQDTQLNINNEHSKGKKSIPIK